MRYSFFSTKQIVLFFLSCLFLFIFYSLEPNKILLVDRNINSFSRLQEQYANSPMEQRYLQVIDPNLVSVIQNIKTSLKSELTDSSYFLFQPNDYLRKIGLPFVIQEPALLYYNFQLRSVWTDSSFYPKVKYLVRFTTQNQTFKYGIEKVENFSQVQSFVREYQPYSQNL